MLPVACSSLGRRRLPSTSLPLPLPPLLLPELLPPVEIFEWCAEEPCKADMELRKEADERRPASLLGAPAEVSPAVASRDDTAKESPWLQPMLWPAAPRLCV